VEKVEEELADVAVDGIGAGAPGGMIWLTNVMVQIPSNPRPRPGIATEEAGLQKPWNIRPACGDDNGPGWLVIVRILRKRRRRG
jgi:hypothetical protein